MSVPTRVHHGLAFNASWTEYMSGCIPSTEREKKREKIIFRMFELKINLATVESIQEAKRTYIHFLVCIKKSEKLL